MKRQGRDLNAYYLSETSQTEKTVCYLIPAVWCEDSKTRLPRVWGQEKMNTEHIWFLGQWNYSAGYYNDGYMSLYICQNP